MAGKNKQSKQANTPKADKPIVAVKAAPQASQTLEAIDAQLDIAMKAGDKAKCQQLFNERAKAEKSEAKAHSEFVKANAEKFANARIELSNYLTEAIDDAVAVFAKACGSIESYIGDKLQAVRYTPLGVVDKTGVASTKSSTALNLPTAKKQASIRVGNFNAGKRGDMLGSGMSEAQIVAKFGSEAEQAEYNELAKEHTANRNKCYGMAVKLWKANK